MDFKDSSYKLSSSYSHITKHGRTSDDFFLSGCIITKHGIVSVYSQEGYSRLDFVVNGRRYIRESWEFAASKALTRRANRFAEELSGEYASVKQEKGR